MFRKRRHNAPTHAADYLCVFGAPLLILPHVQFDRNGDGFLNVSEFIIAMGVVSDAYDADGDGVADMKQGGGEYDGKEEEFAEKLALGENLTVAGMEHDNIHKMTEDARKLQGV